MSEQPFSEGSPEYYILNAMVPGIVALRAYGVSRLEVDLTEMSIHLLLPPKAEQVQISLTSIPLTTDPQGPRWGLSSDPSATGKPSSLSHEGSDPDR